MRLRNFSDFVKEFYGMVGLLLCWGHMSGKERGPMVDLWHRMADNG